MPLFCEHGNVPAKKLMLFCPILSYMRYSKSELPDSDNSEKLDSLDSLEINKPQSKTNMVV